MEPTKVSKKLLNRLALYLEYLRSLPEHSENISATAIAKGLGLGEVQVRKDLAKISQTGRKRVGRNREQLIQDIETHLDLAAGTGTILVGAGQLGQSLMNGCSFAQTGLNIMAAFDFAPDVPRSTFGMPVYSMSRIETFCKFYDVRVGIIAVPVERAQSVCDCLVACGIRAIWNYAPVDLTVPEYVQLQSAS